MAQTAKVMEPGRVIDDRGMGATATASLAARKTGYRADAQPAATNNSLNPTISFVASATPGPPSPSPFEKDFLLGQ